jgi:hypothetical protein
MKRATCALAFTSLLALSSGCGGSIGREPAVAKPLPATHPGKKGASMAEEAAESFHAALQSMVAHDKANNWNDAQCTQVAKLFLAAAEVQRTRMQHELPQATYNAGLAFQRCKKDTEAKNQFQAVLNAAPQFHHARVQMALYDVKDRGDQAIEDSIRQLNQAVQDAKFQNAEALVHLAALQMRRRSEGPDADGANDLDRAKRNLQRALAIDDGYQPALNELALYYLEMAKIKAGKFSRRGLVTIARTSKPDQQMLELAALVCSQAIRKDSKYAAIHNTAGLIQVELQNINSAVQEFQMATQLDPDFFEAQMNYAAVNLSFRGFEVAEKAYRTALRIRPNHYEARLGLALAIRGQIGDANFAQKVREAQAELDQCKKVQPDRAETYYNEGILTEEFKAKVVKQRAEDAIPILSAAIDNYQTFVAKAGNAPEFQDAVKRANVRSQDLGEIIRWLKDGQNPATVSALQREREAARADESGTADEEPPPAQGDQAGVAAGDRPRSH